MHLSFRATLSPIGIFYSTIWFVGGPAIINEGVLCLGAHKKQRFAEDWCLHTFFFQDKGKDHAAQSKALWTLQLQLSRAGFSKPLDTAIILQLAVTKQCTSSRRCVWPLHPIHCQPACPRASSSLKFQATLSHPNVPDGSEIIKSQATLGIHCPSLTTNNLH